MSISKKFIGHAALFAVVAAIMAVNAVILSRTQSKVAQEKNVAEEAAKPAQLAITLLTAPECKECFSVENMIATIKSNPAMEITKEESVEYTSDQGVELVQKYGVTRVPTVLIAGEVDKAFDEPSFVENIGKRAEDGTLVVLNVPAPYVELPSGAVKGKFSVTYLADAACKECYDVGLHRSALANLAMSPAEEKFADRSESDGRKLISEYKIDSLPTILISGDLALYPQFAQIWPSVGTVEKDGMHIFRAGQPLMGAYKDLKTGKIVKPEPPAAEAQQPSPSTQQGQ